MSSLLLRADGQGRQLLRADGGAALVVLGLGILVLPLAVLFGRGLASLTQFVSLFLVAFAFYLGACGLVLRVSVWGTRLSLALIVGFALLFRAAMLFTTPALSDDIYRYVWDGRVTSHGINPYSYSPDSPALAFLRDRLWEGINHKHMKTPYPPLAQATLALAYWGSPDNLKPLQVAAAATDVLVIATLLALLRLRGLPGQRVLVYAWNPLTFVQFAHSAHNDPLMLWLLLAALWLTLSRRPYLGATALAGATLAKLVPLLAAPLLARRWGPRPALLFVLLLPVGYLPFLGDPQGVVQGIFYEAGDARFNESLFYVFARGLGLLVSSPEAAARTVTLALLGLWIVYLVLRPPGDPAGGPLRGAYLVLGAYLLLSPSVEPWYLAWVLPFLCFYLKAGAGRWPFALTPALGWLLLSGLVELTELTYGGASPRLWIVVRAVEYGPLYLLLGMEVARWLPGVRAFFVRASAQWAGRSARPG